MALEDDVLDAIASIVRDYDGLEYDGETALELIEQELRKVNR